MIDPTLILNLKAAAKEADEQGRLTKKQLEIIYKEKWFKLFVPREQHGLELSLPEGLELEEALAKIDGSLGWTITLCAGASQFTGYLPRELTNSIFENPGVCFGGSGAPAGVAVITPDGFEINGYWKYTTGSPYCTHFTANCRIEKDGQPVLNEDGTPVVHSFLFERNEVAVDKDWNAMGLKATASDSFFVQNLKVPANRCFEIDIHKTTLPGMIYKYPFLQFAEATLAVNTFGMAQHFLSEFEQLVQQKVDTNRFTDEQADLMQTRWKMADNHLQKLRTRFYGAVNESWECLLTERSIPEKLLHHITHLSRGLTRSSRELVGDLYPYCGVNATQNGTVINRIFRDIFTASQHLLLNL